MPLPAQDIQIVGFTFVKIQTEEGFARFFTYADSLEAPYRGFDCQSEYFDSQSQTQRGDALKRSSFSIPYICDRAPGRRVHSCRRMGDFC